MVTRVIGACARAARVLACTAILASSASAQITVNPPAAANHQVSASFPGTNANVTLSPSNISHVQQPSADFLTKMRAQFPGFTFNYGGQLRGTLQINEYKATATGSSGGARLTATYTPHAMDPSLGNLRFLQMITTSDPASGATSPYVDPVPNDDTLPFYFTNTEDATFKDPVAGVYNFEDNASRPYPAPAFPVAGKSWGATLFLASFNSATNTVTVYDGVSWGFYIQQYP